MNKRLLTEQEQTICKKQIERFTKELKTLKDVIEYAQRKLQFKEVEWDFEDFAKPLERNQTRENTKKTIENAQNEIKELREKITDLTKQMKDGVSVPSGTG